MDRARRWMKLILTAEAQLASIARWRRAASRRGAYLGGARRWGCGWRSTVMVVVMGAASFCDRDLPLGARPAGELQQRHRQRRPRPPPNRRHVCPPPVNWLPPVRVRPAALDDALLRPGLPHILDQRGRSPPAQDDLGRCARRAPQERLDPDQAGERRRGLEARARLQRCRRLQDLVRQSRLQPVTS